MPGNPLSMRSPQEDVHKRGTQGLTDDGVLRKEQKMPVHQGADAGALAALVDGSEGHLRLDKERRREWSDAKVIAGQPSGSLGSLSREQILAVVRTRLREFYLCYERERLRRPDLRGKVVLMWSIDLFGFGVCK